MKMNQDRSPIVSVIIPVYNVEQYLRQNLDSVLGQTLQDIEVICVDDGSTDRSLTILREYEAEDDRLKVVTQPNINAGAARNNGLQYAKGKYLSFLDSDDFFESDLLEKAVKRAEETAADIVAYSCDFYLEDEDRLEPVNWTIRKNLLPDREVFAGTDVEQDLFRAFVGWPWDKLFRADFIRESGLQYQEQRTTNDLLFVYAALARAGRITLLDDVLVHQRRRSSKSLSVTREKSWDCCYFALKALKEQLISWGLYEHYERDYVNYCVEFMLWNLRTLKEPSLSKLLEALRGGWFAELGVTPDYGRRFFYNNAEYSQLCDIMEGKFGQQRNIVVRTWRCLQENGISYTVRQMGKRMIGKND